MYFITVMRRNENATVPLDHVRCFGYVSSLVRATDIVNENETDIHEGLYNWAVIEEIDEGILVGAKKQIWFQWDRQLEHWIHHSMVPGWAAHIQTWAIL